MNRNQPGNDILVVDVRGVRRTTIEYYLRRLGYNPITVDSSKDALRIFYEIKDLPVIAVFTGAINPQPITINTSRMLDVMHSLRPDLRSLMITDQDVKRFTQASAVLPLKFEQQALTLTLNNILEPELKLAA